MNLEESLSLVLCALLAIVWGCGTEEPDAVQDKPDAVQDKPDTRQDAEDVATVELEDFTNSIGMEFKLIPAGEFMMGSPEDEEERYDNEGPVHRVRITKPFYFGVYEVTQGQWETLMGTRPWEGLGYAKSNPAHAVSYVSRDDAVEFCGKLSAEEGRTYRLPTEAEWEYACRAGSTTAYGFGDSSENLSDYAWWGGMFGDGNCQDEQYAHEVGQKRANTWGLYDMHGNVWERCSDWCDSNYYPYSPTDNPPGPTTGLAHVDRGGSWRGLGGCRSALRNMSPLGFRAPYLGFRVALNPAE